MISFLYENTVNEVAAMSSKSIVYQTEVRAYVLVMTMTRFMTMSPGIDIFIFYCSIKIYIYHYISSLLCVTVLVTRGLNHVVLFSNTFIIVLVQN
jgi:hypothetical protein